jgi:hypothetical protein
MRFLIQIKDLGVGANSAAVGGAVAEPTLAMEKLPAELAVAGASGSASALDLGQG